MSNLDNLTDDKVVEMLDVIEEGLINMAVLAILLANEGALEEDHEKHIDSWCFRASNILIK